MTFQVWQGVDSEAAYEPLVPDKDAARRRQPPARELFAFALSVMRPQVGAWGRQCRLLRRTVRERVCVCCRGLGGQAARQDIPKPVMQLLRGTV